MEIIEVIFKSHYNEFLSFAYRYVMDVNVAKDVVQDVFVSFINNYKNLPKSTNYTGYLFSSIKNGCMDHFKHLNVRDSNQSKLIESLIFSGTEMYEKDPEIVRKINYCISNLSPAQKKVFKMKFVENFSYEKIARQMEISETTVHTHIKRAYKQIRENLYK